MLLAGYCAPVAALQVNVLRGVGDGASFLRGDILKKILPDLIYIRLPGNDEFQLKILV